MYFIRVVTKEFRKKVKFILPGLTENPAYWSLFGYLAFGYNLSEETGQLELSYALLANLAGKSSKHRHFNARKYLDSFIKDVYPFEYTCWNRKKKLPRQLKRLVWPDELKDLITKETIDAPSIKNKVFLHNGKPFTPYSKQNLLKNEKTKAESISKENIPEEERELLDYMNNHPPKMFEKALGNLENTFNSALLLKKDAFRECNILKNILLQSQPFYKPTSNSTRIFPTNGNILCLKRELRKQLTLGWIEMDLKSAQLAICTKLMPLPVTYDFLKQGNGIWKHLMKDLNIPENAQNKDILKKTLYSLIFGATKKALKTNLLELGAGKYEKFLQNTIINELIKARNKAFRKIRKNKGATDCFGRWIPCSSNEDKRSVLAQLAQAYELKLLYPAVEYAKVNIHRFRIILWQHDGFSLVIFDKKRVEQIIFSLKFAVENEAKRQNIPTELETTYNN